MMNLFFWLVTGYLSSNSGEHLYRKSSLQQAQRQSQVCTTLRHVSERNLHMGTAVFKYGGFRDK